MADSKTQVCNLAISHLGSGKTISNVDTEQSAEARSCRAFYSQVQDELLRGFYWPFATKIRDLSLVDTDPSTEWAYSYTYPSDCLTARRIVGCTRNDTRDTVVPFKEFYGDSGTLIYTDKIDAELEYTVRVSDVLRWPPDFVAAFAFRLAAYIAPQITAGDPFKRGDRSLELYKLSVTQAMAIASNEEKRDAEPESEFIRGRD